MPEVQDQLPATAERKPQTAFAAAFDKALNGEEAKTDEPTEAASETPPPKKKKVEPPAEQKSTTPRELFKPKVETKPGEAARATSEIKSAFDEITPPEFKDEKGKKGWDALKTEAKTLEAKVKQIERETAERKAAGRDSDSLEAKLEEAQKTLKEYDEIVSRARLDDHPAFRKEFVDGRQKIVDRAKSIIDESDGDPKSIETALNLKGKARAEALREVSANLDSFQAARLGRAVDELNDLDERAQVKRDAAKKSYDEIREQDRQREIEDGAARSKKRGVEFSEVSKRLRNELEVLQHVDGFDDHNTRGLRILKEAQEYVDAHPEADIEAEILARSVPAHRDIILDYGNQIDILTEKASKLEAELKAIHNKNPSLAARATASSSGKSDSRRPFSEAIGQFVNGES